MSTDRSPELQRKLRFGFDMITIMSYDRLDGSRHPRIMTTSLVRRTPFSWGVSYLGIRNTERRG